MGNYFQKIASRSGTSVPTDTGDIQNILPDRPALFNEKQNDLFEEVDRQSDFIPETPISSPFTSTNLNDKPGEGNDTMNLKPKQLPIQPTTERTSGLKKNELSQIDSTDYSNPANKNILQPSITVIEKISQRNLQNTIIEKKSAEIKSTIDTNEHNRVSNVMLPGKENIPRKKIASIKANNDEPVIAAANKQLQPEQPFQKLRERLIPVQKDNISPGPIKKAKQENKLVIGRITVEVINQVQPNTKIKGQPIRQKSTNKISNNDFSGNNKLSFGLGQM